MLGEETSNDFLQVLRALKFSMWVGWLDGGECNEPCIEQ
jgi:hypothetical protein